MSYIIQTYDRALPQQRLLCTHRAKGHDLVLSCLVFPHTRWQVILKVRNEHHLLWLEDNQTDFSLPLPTTEISCRLSPNRLPSTEPFIRQRHIVQHIAGIWIHPMGSSFGIIDMLRTSF